jgi:multicomponent Na+:H+ antiporter subunit E
MSRACQWISAVVLRTIGFLVVWWALSEGEPGMWTYGAVIAPLATLASVFLVRPAQPRVGPIRRTVALVRLGRWFLWQSFLGGVDVARRAVRRPVDVNPGLVEYRIGLASAAGRVAVADLITLMPGTLAVDLDDDVLCVHVLDSAMATTQQLAELEARVARVVGRR